MVLQPKRWSFPSFILQFICTMDQEYPTMGGPRVGNAVVGMNRLKLLSFILTLWMIPSFPRKSKLDLFLPRKAFSSPHSYLSPLKFSNPFLLNPFPFIYPALSGLVITRGPLAQAGGPLFVAYTWTSGAHSIFLKWHHWNLCQPPNSCSAGRFPQGIISCLRIDRPSSVWAFHHCLV